MKKILIIISSILISLISGGVLMSSLKQSELKQDELYKLNVQKAKIELQLRNVKKQTVENYKEYLRLKEARMQIMKRIDELVNSGSIPVDLTWMPEYINEHPELLKDYGDVEYNEDGKLQKKFPNKVKTVKEFLEKYDLGYTYDYWYKMGRQYKIKPELAICIAWADSNLGRALKGANNIGNVGVNDRGNVVHLPSIWDGIEHIFIALNNKYLGKINTIGGLSCGGRIKLKQMGVISDNQLCGNKGVYVYSTSQYNRNNNVINCMKKLVDKNIDETYNFRLNK